MTLSPDLITEAISKGYAPELWTEDKGWEGDCGTLPQHRRCCRVLVLQPCVPQHERVYWGEEYCLRALNGSGGTLGMPWVLEGDARDCGEEAPPPSAEGKAGAQAQAPCGRPCLGRGQ